MTSKIAVPLGNFSRTSCFKGEILTSLIGCLDATIFHGRLHAVDEAAGTGA